MALFWEFFTFELRFRFKGISTYMYFLLWLTFSFLDVIFGTFAYRPDELPERLGVAEPTAYPRSNQFWRIMLIPFQR